MPLLDSVTKENYAEILLWALNETRKEPLKKNDIVLIRYDVPSLPLVEALYSHLIDAHLMPVSLAQPTPAMQKERYVNSSYKQLLFQPPGVSEIYSAAAGVINILSPQDVTFLKSIDPWAIAQARKADATTRQILEHRKNLGLMGVTTCLYPTKALATASGMTMTEYTHALRRACWLNNPSPLKEWKQLQHEVDEVCQWLDSLQIRRLHVESNDINLKIPIGTQRRFIGINGTNIPGYEIYIAPDACGIEGTYYADQPSLRYGHWITGVSLDFSEGVVTRAEANRGDSFLQNQLQTDSGARRVGEFSLTDTRFSQIDTFMAHTLLDENHGGEYGNCHLALGASVMESFTGSPELLTPEYEYFVGLNASNMHWDLVNTQPKRVTAYPREGKPLCIYENGKFRF